MSGLNPNPPAQGAISVVGFSICTAVSAGAGGALGGHQKAGLQFLLRLEQNIFNCLRTYWTAVLEMCGRRRLESVFGLLSADVGFPLLPHGFGYSIGAPRLVKGACCSFGFWGFLLV